MWGEGEGASCRHRAPLSAGLSRISGPELQIVGLIFVSLLQRIRGWCWEYFEFNNAVSLCEVELRLEVTTLREIRK